MQDQESFAEKTAEPMQISAQDAVDSHLECVKYMTIYVKLGETILIYIYRTFSHFSSLSRRHYQIRPLRFRTCSTPTSKSRRRAFAHGRFSFFGGFSGSVFPHTLDPQQNKEESFCKCYFLTFLEVSQLEFFELLWNIWGAGKLC